ncbi:transposase [Leptotrichia sp. HSP-342]|uniref:Transposase n=1 Tax=Leptotrichia mesophila TaxID=3239303 RepID=A0AB39VEE1_9FUSO
MNQKSSTIRKLLLCHSNRIKKVGMKMFIQFRNTVYSYLPHTDIIADKYHVIR